MAVQTEPALLDYLHDARCCSVAWNCCDSSARHISIVADVDHDCDYEPWRGKRISVTFFDAVACRFTGWGYQAGMETVDAYRDEVSPEFKCECERLRDTGIEIPPLIFTIVLGSGSTVEIACREVVVDTI